jgi:hypothetical protein
MPRCDVYVTRSTRRAKPQPMPAFVELSTILAPRPQPCCRLRALLKQLPSECNMCRLQLHLAGGRQRGDRVQDRQHEERRSGCCGRLRLPPIGDDGQPGALRRPVQRRRLREPAPAYVSHRSCSTPCNTLLHDGGIVIRSAFPRTEHRMPQQQRAHERAVLAPRRSATPSRSTSTWSAR